MTLDDRARVAVVTGAGGGLGAAVSRTLMEGGHRVTLVGRDMARLEQTRAIAPDRAQCVPADLSEMDANTTVLDQALNHWGKVDVLINAAAILRRQPLENVSEESIAEVFSVNFAAPFWLCRAGIRDMEKRSWGRIVNVTSVGVHTGGQRVTSAVYEASKAALSNLTKTLARHCKDSGVLVNSVAVGAMKTRMMTAESPAEVLEEFEAAIPVGRVAEPREVAHVVAFLASESNTYVTGATIDVNGGLIMP